MSYTYIGIDPGLSGALVAITDNIVRLEQLRFTIGNQFDVAWLQDLLIRMNPRYVLVERQMARVKQAGQALIMQNYGRITATLDLCGVQWSDVTPQKWQKYHGVTGSKYSHIEKAKALGFDVPFKAYNNDGSPRANSSRWHDAADAYLIAEYARHCGIEYYES